MRNITVTGDNRAIDASLILQRLIADVFGVFGQAWLSAETRIDSGKPANPYAQQARA